MIRSPLVTRAILEGLVSQVLPEWHRIESVVKVRSLKAGDRLFGAEQQHPFVYFVNRGIIKMIYETIEGKVWIKAFAEEGRFFASLTGLESTGRTSFSALSVCDAVVEQVPYRILQELADAHPSWQKVLRRAFEVYGFRKEARERELLTLSAEERYRRFIDEQGELAARLSHKDLAGYIRVTPVALSRIKGRVQHAAGTKTTDK